MSLDLSLQALISKDKEASRFFALLGLLPAGASDEDFDRIYGKNWMDKRDILLRSSLIIKTEKDRLTFYKLYPFMTKYAEEHLSK